MMVVVIIVKMIKIILSDTKHLHRVYLVVGTVTRVSHAFT